MVPSNVLQRVFFIKSGKRLGSAFSAEIEDEQYLTTAKHVVNNLRDNRRDEHKRQYIEIFQKQNWLKVYTKVYFADEGIDIAVLKLIDFPLPKSEINLNSNGFYFSQDAYFLGFPYGQFFIVDKKGINNYFPIPFAKRCIISADERDEFGIRKIFLDGFANPGFSGGPVFFKNLDTNKFHICSVVAGFPLDKDNFNTGIILTYDIKHAIELINSLEKKVEELIEPRSTAKLTTGQG